MKRTTAHFLIGALVGISAAVVVYGVVRAARAEDADRLARKLARRIGKLESRVEAPSSVTIPKRA